MPQRKIDKTINAKVLIRILFVSGLITFIITATQVYRDYRTGVEVIEQELRLLEKTYSKTITGLVWEFNEEQLSEILDGILTLPNIVYIKLAEFDEVLVEKGDSKVIAGVERKISLIYEANNKENNIGTLIIRASIENLVTEIKSKVFFIFISQAMKTFLTSILIWLIVQSFITKHVIQFSKFFLSDDFTKWDKKLLLNKNKGGYDEIDNLEACINHIREELAQEFQLRKNAELELRNLNIELEKKVEERSNLAVESQKTAVLGQLAAGVAHEVNSPLTTIHLIVKHILLKNKDNKLTSEELQRQNDKILKLVERLFSITEGLKIFSIREQNQEKVKIDLVLVIEYLNRFVTAHHPRVEFGKKIFGSGQTNFYIYAHENTVKKVLLSLINYLLQNITFKNKSWFDLSLYLETSNVIVEFTTELQEDVEYLEKMIFDPFNIQEGIDRGNGLELSWIKTMLDSQEGVIAISESNKNLKVKFTFSKIEEADT